VTARLSLIPGRPVPRETLPVSELCQNYRVRIGTIGQNRRWKGYERPGFIRIRSDGSQWLSGSKRTENPGVGGSIPSLPTS